MGNSSARSESDPSISTKPPSNDDIDTEIVYSTESIETDENSPQINLKKDHKTVVAMKRVQNARNSQLQFETHGFELVEHFTTLSYSNFLESDEEKIKRVYYDELCQYVKLRLRAKHVVAFHHNVRSSKPESEKKAPAVTAHADYTARKAVTLYNKIAVNPEYRRGRFVVLNIWRNIHEDRMIVDHHLACCDANTITVPDDFLPLKNPDRYGLNILYKHRHQWYYYPYMTKNEMLMFIQYDSNPQAKARFCFHSSIRDFNANSLPTESTIRESIEVRLIAFLPDHEMDTVPHMNENVKDDDVSDIVNYVVNRILIAIRHLDKWEDGGRNWFLSTMNKSDGVNQTIQGLVWSGNQRGLFGLKHATKDQQIEIISRLKASSFGEIARNSIERFLNK